MTSLRNRWRAFLTVIFDPLSVALLISTAFLAVSLVFQTDRSIVAILTFLVTVFSGLLGGVLGKKWDDLAGEKIIVARGKSAIRNLKFLLSNAVALQRRVRQYLNQCIEEDKKRSPTSDVVATYLEDVAGRCLLLEEGIISSIESWTDITPEADIKTQIGVISELTSKVDNLTQDLNTLGSELQETKGKTEKEIEKLKAEKRQKEKELLELRQELSGRAINFGLPLSSGNVPWSDVSLLGVSKGDAIYPSTLLGVSSSMPKQTCTACGTQYQNILSSGTDRGLCPACQLKMLIEKS
jgi:hypothetical protein